MPLIICPAGNRTVAGIDKRHLVSGLDILPTTCDYAGLPIPESLEGTSLRLLVEHVDDGLKAAWRDHLVLEINDRTKLRMVRSDRYKYIVNAKGWLRNNSRISMALCLSITPKLFLSHPLILIARLCPSASSVASSRASAARPSCVTDFGWPASASAVKPQAIASAATAPRPSHPLAAAGLPGGGSRWLLL